MNYFVIISCNKIRSKPLASKCIISNLNCIIIFRYSNIFIYLFHFQIGAQSEICHSCYIHFISQPSTSATDVPMSETATSTTEVSESLPVESNILTQQVIQHPLNSSDEIILPDYIRAKETERKCFLEGFSRSGHRIPYSIRKNVLNMTIWAYSDIPPNNRLCEFHLYRGRMSLTDAANTYGIPKSTLNRKTRNINCTQEKAGHPTVFVSEEERIFHLLRDASAS